MAKFEISVNGETVWSSPEEDVAIDEIHATMNRGEVALIRPTESDYKLNFEVHYRNPIEVPKLEDIEAARRAAMQEAVEVPSDGDGKLVKADPVTGEPQDGTNPPSDLTAENLEASAGGSAYREGSVAQKAPATGDDVKVVEDDSEGFHLETDESTKDENKK